MEWESTFITLLSWDEHNMTEDKYLVTCSDIIEIWSFEIGECFISNTIAYVVQHNILHNIEYNLIFKQNLKLLDIFCTCIKVYWFCDSCNNIFVSTYKTYQSNIKEELEIVYINS